MARRKISRRVEAKWVVGLGDKIKLMVKKGDKVAKGDVLAIEEKEQTECFDMAGVMSTMAKSEMDEWVKKWKGKKVAQDDVMVKKKGFLGKKVFFPTEGKCLGMDEFFKMCFEVGGKVKREIISPVTARVEKIGKEKMVLSFEAMEFRGEAMVEGRVWGECMLTSVDKETDLDSGFDNKIILSTDTDESLLTKMEVVGVVGLITKQKKKEDFLTMEMPVLSLDKRDWEDLTALSTEGEKRILLNTRAGRLLLVV